MGGADLKREARKAARSDWVEWLGRMGLLAQGLSYALVGVLALMLALDVGGAATNRVGALRALADERAGKLLIAVLAGGFAGYAIWRFAEALFDRGGDGDDAKGLGKRAVQFAKGCLYAGLTFSAISILVGSGTGAGGGGGRKEAIGVLGWPGGRVLVGGAGIVVACVALYQLYRAWSKRFERPIDTHEMDATQRAWFERFARAGLVARGVVFGVIAWFLVKAAVQFDRREPVGIGGALGRLARAPYGPALLAATGAGLVAFGVFCAFQARYRRV